MKEPLNKVQNEQQYYQGLLEIVKKRLDLYSRWTVATDEEGMLTGIKGKLLFQKELEKLCEAPFEPEEIAAYKEEMADIKEQETILRKQAVQFIQKGNMIALEYLCRIFSLGDFEFYLLSMALAPQLDAQFERVFCLLQDDYGLKLPTLDLCIRVLTLDEEERLLLQQQVAERLPLLSFFFEDLEKGEDPGGEKRSGLSLPLKLDGRILLFLQDITGLDEELKSFTNLLLPGDVPGKLPIRQEYADQLVRLMKHAGPNSFLYLSGSKGIGKRTLVGQLCRESNRPVLLIHTKILCKEGNLSRKLKRLIRESYLRSNAWLCFTDVELSEDMEEGAGVLETLLWGLQEYRGIPIFTTQTPWNPAWDMGERSCYTYPVPELDTKERQFFWEAFLPKEEWPKDVTSVGISGKYQLTPGGIEKSVEEARISCLWEKEKKLTAGMLYAACQKQLVHKLGKDALRVKSPYVWEDLILPEAQKKLLRDACHQVEYRHQVFQNWGFAGKVAYGRGVSMIFYGPPGTGKTMGAQVMANELGLELYKVNMASIMSRYVGDSEKKLDVVFEQGRKSQSILFFDEADVLFGKRSETKDAQDRYANASTAYLLQKVEEYEGILILATNFLQNFDNAFCRRFKFIIEFPFPDETRRLEIWNHVFPKQMELQEPIDTKWLAEEFLFSGSQIKNIALAASFLAAGEESGLTMKHVLTALKREQLKVGKQMIASDFGQYYYLME